MRGLIISILLASVFPFAAFAQNANTGMSDLQVTRPIYAWKSENDTNKKTGEFAHCLVKNMYDNGTVLMLAENNEGVKRIALNFPQAKMKTGDHFDLTAQVDKRDLFPVEAVAVSAQILTIGIPEALPDQMRKGQALYLRGPNDEVVYTLDGMDGAVTALQDCVTTQKGGHTTLQTADAQPTTIPAQVEASVTPNLVKQIAPVPANAPVVATTTPTATPIKDALKSLSETFSGEKEIEVLSDIPAAASVTNTAAITSVKPLAIAPTAKEKTAPVVVAQAKPIVPTVAQPIIQQGPPPSVLPDAIRDVFAKAKLEPTTFITTPEKNKESKRPLDYAWIKNELFVGVKEQNTVPQAGINQAALYYLRLLKERCAGPFIAESGTVNADKDLSWLVVEAACSPGKKDDTIAALLFANDAKNLRIYFVEAPADKGADAIKARDAILKALKK